MSNIQTIGPFPNTSLLTAGTATLSKGVARGDDAMSAAALAPPMDRVANHTVGDDPRTSSTTPDPQLQAAMDKINQSANFRVEIETAKGMALPVITVRDRATGEIIRQLPPKQFVAATRQIDSTPGFLFEKVV